MKHHLLSIALAAASTVTFNSADGTGSAGFCDVQAAFGWTTDQMVANADGTTFAIETVDSWAGVCTAGPRHVGETQYPVVTQGVDVNRMVVEYADGPRFVFTGYGASWASGTAPVLGATCHQANGMAGTWTAVEKSNTVSGLFARYGATQALLY